jgi:hypothetical protein
MPVDRWILTWAVGLILALTAAYLGSRKWVYATILPVVTFLVVVGLFANVPF